MKIDFSSGYDSVTTAPLTQWDKGQVLQIYGLELPAVVQVHFVNKLLESAIIYIAYKQDGGYSEVNIPNSLLEQKEDIYAYIYLSDEYEGKTVKTIRIPVTARTKPADFISEPDATEAEIIAELLAKHNHTAEMHEEAVALIDKYRTFSDVRIMTKAEYEALEEKEGGKIYVFSDDTTLDEIEDALDAIDEFASNGKVAEADHAISADKLTCVKLLWSGEVDIGVSDSSLGVTIFTHSESLLNKTLKIECAFPSGSVRYYTVRIETANSAVSVDTISDYDNGAILSGAIFIAVNEDPTELAGQSYKNVTSVTTSTSDFTGVTETSVRFSNTVSARSAIIRKVYEITEVY